MMIKMRLKTIRLQPLVTLRYVTLKMIICKLNPMELQVLTKHFNIIDDGEIKDNSILIFSKKDDFKETN